MDQNPPSPYYVNVPRGELVGGTDPNLASSWRAGMSPGSSWAPTSGGADFTSYAMPPPQFYEPSMFHAPPPPTPSYDFPMSAPPPKVPIPRASGFNTHSQRRRSARACEPCRQRKIKCDGTRPSCKQCVENQVKCFYLDVKRVREQKELGALARKVERYERLLEELESDLDDASARRIRRALSVFSIPFFFVFLPKCYLYTATFQIMGTLYIWMLFLYGCFPYIERSPYIKSPSFDYPPYTSARSRAIDAHIE